MEAYKTTCPDCGYVRDWVGYKTGIGKTPQQLQKMRDDRVTCVRCGSKNASTQLDRESKTGKVFGEMDDCAANILVDLIYQWSNNMLDVLHRVESQLPQMLDDRSGWNSLFVDYHPPAVERLWRQWLDFRIYLHRIHPCNPGEALFHPHPWPSAMRVLNGTYEMAVGWGKGKKEPLIAARMILVPGCEYEMTDPDGWHSVRPLKEPSFSLMVTGHPWDSTSSEKKKPLGKLSLKKEELFKFFREYYGVR